jgi:hypothetical protein
MNSPTLFDGMHAAQAHAERQQPGWTELALAFLQRFPLAEFIAEDVAKAARGFLPDPPDSRAWGAVFNTARRRKLIEKTGAYRGAVTSNGSPKPVWRKA